EPEPEPVKSVLPVIDNEFGTPSDDDWLIDDVSGFEPEPLSDAVNATAQSVESDELMADEAEVRELAPSAVENDALPPSDSVVAEPVSSPSPSEKDVMDEQAESAFDFDGLDLPEYGEEEALADASMSSFDVEERSEQANAFESEERFSFDDFELPEYGEQDALADAIAPTSEALSPEAQSFSSMDTALAEAPSPEVAHRATAESDSSPRFNFDDIDDFELLDIDEADLNERLDEQDVLSGLFGDSSSFASAENHAEQALAQSLASNQHYDESTFDELLAEGGDHFTAINKPVDQQTSDSAGLDIEAMLEMGGEDWNGFSLTPELQQSISDDIPEEERQIWSSDNQPSKAEVLNEDWGNQDNLEDFNPRDNHYRTIDELMAEVELEEGVFNPDEEALKLDVGLSDFPDVIGQMSDVDVDANAEASGKLDLAKIYMEMNDAAGAVKLLEEAIVDGDDAIRREAKGLIDAINGR
ncbi:FimV/HubP family polar landmark protein, partial [Vibrio renipiscarius]|uniref:FimV/HubP family polar landmark protein n=1 Tax=Vibrio renipiscarius TaxID=1461322 RepID=UPI00354BB02A